MARPALGKGLGALIPDAKGPARAGVVQLPLGEIHPNPQQPRKAMASQPLKELMASIQEKGILQPVVVRARGGGGYEVIMGERRYRAAKALGLATLPAVIKDVADQDMLELAVIENIQREDLTPLEQAEAFQQLLGAQQLTHEELSKKLGKDRATISNTLRLLKLPPELHPHLHQGSLTPAHGLVLLSLTEADQQRRLGTKIVQEGLSVKQAEGLAQALQPAKPRKKSFLKPPPNVHLKKAEADIQRKLGTKVRIQGTNKKGRIVIEYYTLADLERILDRLT